MDSDEIRQLLKKIDERMLKVLLEEELKLYLLLLISSKVNIRPEGLEFSALCRALGPVFDKKKLCCAAEKIARMGLGTISVKSCGPADNKKNKQQLRDTTFVRLEL